MFIRSLCDDCSFLIIRDYTWLSLWFVDYSFLIIRDYFIIILSRSLWLFVIIWCPGQQHAASLHQNFALLRGTSWRWHHIAAFELLQGLRIIVVNYSPLYRACIDTSRDLMDRGRRRARDWTWLNMSLRHCRAVWIIRSRSRPGPPGHFTVAAAYAADTGAESESPPATVGVRARRSDCISKSGYHYLMMIIWSNNHQIDSKLFDHQIDGKIFDDYLVINW